MSKKSVLVVLLILALGSVGTGLSALYQRMNWYPVEPYDPKTPGPTASTIKVSYGFPLAWHWYSQTANWFFIRGNASSIPKVYGFSLESLLLDTEFWLIISFLLYFSTMKAVNLMHKKGTSKKLSVINI